MIRLVAGNKRSVRAIGGHLDFMDHGVLRPSPRGKKDPVAHRAQVFGYNWDINHFIKLPTITRGDKNSKAAITRRDDESTITKELDPICEPKLIRAIADTSNHLHDASGGIENANLLG